MTFSDLVDQYIGLSFRKQLALSDFLGDCSWQADVAKGTLDFGKGPGRFSRLFGKRRIYPILVLGTESEHTGTWLWAWANTFSHFPAGVLQAAECVRSIGEAEEIAEFVTPELPSVLHPGHLLALVANGIEDADCYYRAPHPGGAAFFLIYETPLRQAGPTPLERVARVILPVISEFEVNHRAMARAYLEAEGLRLEEEDSTLSAVNEAGQSLTITFDDLGRIGELTSQGPKRR
jgi:hypothetical protein